MIATVEWMIFWAEHFKRPHVDFLMFAATNEREYNVLAMQAGYQIRKKKDRHKKR